MRIIFELDGEYVIRAEPILGYLHRMHEKIGEIKTLYNSFQIQDDRLQPCFRMELGVCWSWRTIVRL
ncbi:MAG: hypothetical protein LBS66_01305 [Rhodospirillaceae bacterium]|nr:hypothetical protein [Rhodospirillaceae bacterium]